MITLGTLMYNMKKRSHDASDNRSGSKKSLFVSFSRVKPFVHFPKVVKKPCLGGDE